MKFYGEPNLTVNVKSLKIHFKFDDKGEYETDNPKLIDKLKQHFKFDKPKKK